MIIYPAGLPTSEAAAGRPLNNARVGWHSYTRNAIYSDVTVSSEEPAGPRDAPLRPETYEFWQPLEVPATWELNLGADVNVNYVGIAAHTCGSKGNTVLVEMATLLGTFSTFALSHAPADNTPILFLDATRNVGRVRFTFSNGEPPLVAVIYIGLVLPMELSVQPGHEPLPLSRQTVQEPTMSRAGHFLGQNIRSQGVKGSASFVGLSASWYRTNFEPFVHEARSFPFFFAWHPVTYTNEVAYCWLIDDVAPSHITTNLVNVDMRMVGFGSG